MLKEGKVKTSVYHVVWYHNGNSGYEYVEAMTTQQAVDLVRQNSPEGVEIVEVAKVVNNWK